MTEPHCYVANCLNEPESYRKGDGERIWICDEHREQKWFYCIHRDPRQCHWHPNGDGFSYDGRAVCFEEYSRLVRLGSRYFTAHETKGDIAVDKGLFAIARAWNWLENLWNSMRRRAWKDG